jgi:hypothetical protein
LKSLFVVTLLVFIQMFALPTMAIASIIVGPITNPANSHRYLLLSQNTWTASEAEAISLGGHLATVNDAAENSWIYSTFTRFGEVDRTLWIGLNDAAKEGTFVWSSGEPVIYTHWWTTGGSPNNCCGGEDYVQIYDQSRGSGISGYWNDIGDRTVEFGVNLYGVVELPPVSEPKEYLLLLLGICYFFWLRGTFNPALALAISTRAKRRA